MRFNFVEIGTSDFDTLIQQSSSENGLVIEPLKIYLDSLPDKDNCIKVNCAITETDGFVDIFWIHPEDLIKHNLPNWLRGCNSINTPHPSAIQELKTKNLQHIYNKTQCKSMCWNTLIDIYDIKNIDFLKIDTEGHDCVIVNNVLNSNTIFPKKLLFEANTLSDGSVISLTIQKLKTAGYTIVNRTGIDILAEKI
jgi:hypothetical protein